jgi:hypothetical protein
VAPRREETSHLYHRANTEKAGMLALQRHLISRTLLVLTLVELIHLGSPLTFLASGGDSCSRGGRVKDRLLVAWTMAFLMVKLRP